MSLRFALVLGVLPFSAVAEVPSVLADIGPVHSLVARVMDGVDAPVLLLPPGASPHGYAMRPSEAEALERADVVFWVGEALAPWLGDAIGTLAEDALTVELLQQVVERPEAQEESEADHGDDHGDDHAAGHDDDDDPAKAAEDHDDHGHDDHGHDDHGHGHDHGVDPHAWLDPINAKLWLGVIAETLAEVDPENEIIYAANAEAGQAEIDALMIEIRERLAPVTQSGYIVFHDAYGWFEDRFEFPALGSISVSDAVPPSAARVSALRNVVVASEAACVFSEPQFNPGLVDTLTEGTNARSGVLDPLGALLEPGVSLYPTLLRNLSIALAECLDA